MIDQVLMGPLGLSAVAALLLLLMHVVVMSAETLGVLVSEEE
jgi:hypothetical protein